MSVKVCLVTGATGFIGQHIVSELVSAGHKVVALGKSKETYCPAIWQGNHIKIITSSSISDYLFNDNDVVLLSGEIADKPFVEKLFAQIEQGDCDLEYVLHFAACATIQLALKDEAKTWQTNYEGTQNILDVCLNYYRRHSDMFKGFFYASTDKVYGEGSEHPYQETDVLRPLSYPYDQSKAKADIYVRKMAKDNGFPAVVYRFCNVYGPGDYHISRIVPGSLYRWMYHHEAPLLKVYQDEEQKLHSFKRDMIYINDLTHAVLLMLAYLGKKENREAVCGEVYNLGTNNSYTMKEVVENIMQFAGCDVPVHEEIVTGGEIKQQYMDFKKLNQLLEFTPRYSLKEGIKETAAWYISHRGEISEQFI